MPRGNSKNTQYKVSSEKLGGYFQGSRKGQGDGQTQQRASWADIDAAVILAGIIAADKIGMALLFGHNRENTALALGLFYGGEKNTFYFGINDNMAADAETFLWGLVENCTATHEALKGG